MAIPHDITQQDLFNTNHQLSGLQSQYNETAPAWDTSTEVAKPTATSTINEQMHYIFSSVVLRALDGNDNDDPKSSKVDMFTLAVFTLTTVHDSRKILMWPWWIFIIAPFEFIVKHVLINRTSSIRAWNTTAICIIYCLRLLLSTDLLSPSIRGNHGQAFSHFCAPPSIYLSSSNETIHLVWAASICMPTFVGEVVRPNSFRLAGFAHEISSIFQPGWPFGGPRNWSLKGVPSITVSGNVEILTSGVPGPSRFNQAGKFNECQHAHTIFNVHSSRNVSCKKGAPCATTMEAFWSNRKIR